MLVADWSFQIASALLEAAVSCEAVCDRRWVSDGSRVEQPAPPCPCQLVAVITEGLEATTPAGPIGCGSTHFAVVRLLLDLCTESPPGERELPDPVAQNTRAQANASTRWLMLQGMQMGWASGALTTATEDPQMPPALQRVWRVVPGEWRATWSTGGMARWEMTWRFTSDDVSVGDFLGS